MSCHIRRSDCFLQCYLMTILLQSHQRVQDSNKLLILFGKRFATHLINACSLIHVLHKCYRLPPDLLIAPSSQYLVKSPFSIRSIRPISIRSIRDSDGFILIPKVFSARWFVCNERLSLAEDLDELRSWVLFW